MIPTMSLKSTARKVRGDARTFALKMAASAGRFAGRRCLDREETILVLQQNGSTADGHGVFHLDSAQTGVIIDILNSGVVRLDHMDCLDLDYGARGALRGWTGEETSIGHAAALWSHRWMGYYHWLIDVAPKIAAIQASAGAGIMDCRWVFPRSGEAYESEILAMLGVPEMDVIDSLRYRSVQVESISMVALPGWYQIQPAAALLRERLLPFGESGLGERIFLKRRGRRACINEDEALRFLKPRGFVMVEDEPRSVAAQIGIFKSAKLIVAPHGAALANLLWCSAGSRVIECFARGYCPEYYENLAAFSGIDYACVGKTPHTHWTGVGEDIHIDINELAACLENADIS